MRAARSRAVHAVLARTEMVRMLRAAARSISGLRASGASRRDGTAPAMVCREARTQHVANPFAAGPAAAPRGIGASQTTGDLSK